MEEKVIFELTETNLEYLEEEMIKCEFNAILWNCFTVFP